MQSKQGKTKKINTLFIQREIPHYRLRFFKDLAAHDELIFTILLARPKGQDGYEGVLSPGELKNEGINCEAVDAKQVQLFGKKYIYYPGLLQYLLSNRPDVVILGGGLLYWNWILVDTIIFTFLRIFRGIKFVFGLSNVYDEGLSTFKYVKKRIYYKYYLASYVKAFVTYGDRARDALIRFGIIPEKVFAAHNSLDTEELFKIKSQLMDRPDWKRKLLHELGLANQGIVLSLGRIRPEKRIDLLISAFSIISEENSDVVLLIVGEGSNLEALIKQASENPSKGRIYFQHAEYDDEYVAKYFLLSNVAVFPGWISLATQFALCMGTPVICAPFGNELEYLVDGENGLFFEPDNVADLAKKINFVLRHPDLTSKYAKKSEEIIAQKANLKSKVVGHLNAIYYSLG